MLLRLRLILLTDGFKHLQNSVGYTQPIPAFLPTQPKVSSQIAAILSSDMPSSPVGFEDNGVSFRDDASVVRERAPPAGAANFPQPRGSSGTEPGNRQQRSVGGVVVNIS